MRIYSGSECKQRSFARAANVLKGFYEEQAEVYGAERAKGKTCIGLSSRIFDHLINFEYIFVGASEAATKLIKPSKPYKEHLVPCRYIRNLSFEMFHYKKTENDVAGMIRTLLKIAHITNEEAWHIDAKWKLDMPPGWS